VNTTLLKVAVVAAIALGGGGYIAGGEYGQPVSELFAAAESEPCAAPITVAAPSAPAAPAGTAAPSSGLVNLNTATAAQLDALPGIGEKTVQQIIAARPIKSVDAVAALPGVRPNNLAKFRSLVTV
jgi:DNA uptake protein ComE-like DNA-binding protein